MTTYDFIAANKRRSTGLIVVFVIIVMALAYVIDRAYGMNFALLPIAGIYALGSALVGYYAGDKIALAASHAKPVTAEGNPYLVRMVENLCISQGMPVPKIHVIEDNAINAFACGRDPKHASIAVTTGAIQKLENEELEGVLAHELSHIQNYDIRCMTLVIVLVGVVSILADLSFRMSFHRRGNDRDNGSGIFLILGIIMIILAPLIAQLIQLAISRRREFLADASGSLMTRFPEGLARALKKIAADGRPMRSAHSSTAHLFIANPFSGQGLSKLFSTHPPIEERIAALEKMSHA